MHYIHVYTFSAEAIMKESRIVPEMENNGGSSAKKMYCSPQLRVFGQIHRLTNGGSGFNPEGSSGMVGMN